MNSPATVLVRDTSVTLPTYLPARPDRNPMFLEKRVYQGSSGKVYPLPFIDRIAESPVPHTWRAIFIENEYVEVMILPEIGGRIHRFRDKTNGYDAIYHQTVIKPALVGLAGPWVSGGIEFNWPQHHRPSTFMPAHATIEHEPDGAATVWLSEHDPIARMKGMHGVRLRPGSSVLELRARVHNRTEDVQTFLWWANVATEVHERYQSFFPADATFVADHAKRAMATFPLCDGTYYGIRYGERGRKGVPASEQPRQFRPDGSYPANDLSWYANLPVPTSYMCMGTREGFFGGYDHRAQAGIVHYADPAISPGKKQWTWGNQEFGYAWDRLLTDPDENGVHRPYIEIMAGVYTDNQPDFSFLQPGETKSWSQFWYPIRSIGPAMQANNAFALSLAQSGTALRIGVHATRAVSSAHLVVELSSGQTLANLPCTLSPATPLVQEVKLPPRTNLSSLRIRLVDAEGRLLLAHQNAPIPAAPDAATLASLAATEPPSPDQVRSSDELYLTGLHLEQYRHATRCPTAYWKEALRRDEGDSRCNLAMGRWHLRRGEFQQAVLHLRTAVTRQTFRNPNPADGEALFQLARAERHLGELSAAAEHFGKAAWNHAWTAPSLLALAEIDGTRGDWQNAAARLVRVLRLDRDNLRAAALLALALRKLERTSDAAAVLAEAHAADPLDPWIRELLGLPWLGDNQIRLDLAFDLLRAGLLDEARVQLESADALAEDGSLPMVHYTLAFLHSIRGDLRAATRALSDARKVSDTCCFPSRLDEIAVLQHALSADPTDPRAPLLLGHLLYDRRRHLEAIQLWERSARLDPSNPVAWRCLAIGRFNIQRNPRTARAAFAKARRADPDDARLLYEADQLEKRLGAEPETRLRTLRRHVDLVSRRDDLSLEFAGLLNQTGRHEEALATLRSRRFQPWEGGEGVALGQHVRTHLALGKHHLAQGDAAAALTCFREALSCPEALGEARHPLANAADIHFWIGEALHAAGDASGAREAWLRAASFRGDFQSMSVQEFSEMTLPSALALRRIGRTREAQKLLLALLEHARALERTPARIDYFATSLPTMLLFEDDLTQRQRLRARYLQAQALVGLGKQPAAWKLLLAILRDEPGHADAVDLLSSLRAKPATRVTARARASKGKR